MVKDYFERRRTPGRRGGGGDHPEVVRLGRRTLGRAGAATALAALSSLLPFAPRREAFAQGGAPEQKNVRIGVLPTVGATPIFLAEALGLFAEHGLKVEIVTNGSWAALQAEAQAGRFDAAQMPAPVPLALALAAGEGPPSWTVLAILSLGGQALTLSVRHKDKRDPHLWRGFRFAVPFAHSMENYLVRYYVAEHGLDPDKDIRISVVPPNEMAARLKADEIDGFFAPEPFNQRAAADGVGFIYLLSNELWDGHPDGALAVRSEFAAAHPDAYRALVAAVVEASAFAAKGEHRKEIARTLAPAKYLNQPESILEQVLTGTYVDGYGAEKRRDPHRVEFDPYPWDQFAVWILTQMKRWGQVGQDIDYARVAREVFLMADAAAAMKGAGLAPPPDPAKKMIAVMGKRFFADRPAAYIQTFPIKRI